MAPDPPPSEDPRLLGRIQSGDQAAETEVFEQYIERLTALARSRLSARLSARIDPEDVVLSAYRSFFVAARAGRFQADQGGDLWRLLVEVTLHKLYRQVQHHQAQKRSVKRDQRLPDAASLIVARAPSPDEAAAAAEELQLILKHLSPAGRTALELRLQGCERSEIASQLGCSERTVSRYLNEARRIMVRLAGASFLPSAARALPENTPPPAPADFEVLSTLEFRFQWNDFLLQEQIGQGATGRVYRALHKASKKPVAIKFLRKALSGNRSIIEHFVHEWQIVRDLSHPGIVAIHGLGRVNRRGLFLVMDLVTGQDLQQVARALPISAPQAVAWLMEAAHIIHFANQRGVIHCDLKPGNLLLDNAGHIRVTDFGFAAPAAGLLASRLAGTPAFMAPEQIDSTFGPITPRTDVWGLGAVLYYLTTGQPPHAGARLSEVLASAASPAPIVIPQSSLAASHPPLTSILLRCLSKIPAGRFPSAQHLAQALATLPTPG